MKKIFKSKFFLIILFFLVLNLVSYFIILKKLNINIYDKDYSEIKLNVFSSQIYTEIPHPYFGFFNFEQNKDNKENPILFSSVTKITKNKNDSNYLKILFLGGSAVASFSSFYDDNNFKYSSDRKLKKIPQKKNSKNILEKKFTEMFKDQNFIIYNGAANGFKQPQQLFKLYYLNFLGYEFDYIIDISGHHEVVHPFTKNIDYNLPLDWPRGYFNNSKNFITDYSCLKNNKKLQKINSNVPVIEIISLMYIIDCKKKINPKLKNEYYF